MLRRLIAPILLLLLVACADQPATTPTPLPTAPVGEVATSQPVPQRRSKADAEPLPTGTAPAATEESTGRTTQAWTILVYANADNDLAGAVLEDLDEMEAAGPPDNVRVILQVDRGERADAAGESWSGARRYLLATGGEQSQLSSTLLADLGAANMGDPQTLQEFIGWGLEHYPAQHVALWLWGYGADWRALSSDQSAQDALTLAELGKALAGALSGGPMLELVAMDTGYGDQLAALAGLQPYARYAVMTAGLAPAGARDFQTLLAVIDSERPAGGARLAALMAERLALPDSAPLASTSAVGLQAMPPVLAALQSLSAAIQGRPALVAATVADARSGARPFPLSDQVLSSEFSAVDLGLFAGNLAQRSPDVAVAAAAAALQDALQQAILLPEGAETLQQAGVIRLNFPATAAVYDGRYDEVAVAGWREALQAYYEQGLPEIPAPMLSLSQLADSTGGVAQPIFAAFELSGRALGEVTAASWRLEEGGPRLVARSPIPPQAQRLPDGSPFHRWQDGVHEGFTVWDTRGAYLSDGTVGEFVILWPAGSSDDFYTVPGRLAAADGSAGQDAWLLFAAQEGALVGVWTRPEGVGSPIHVIAPPADALFSPYVYREGAGGVLSAEPGTAVQFGQQGPAYSYQPLPAGDYRLGFEATGASELAATAYGGIAVHSEGAGDVQTYLDPYAGFQFHYPPGWTAPVYDGELLTGGDPDGTTTLTVRRYAEEGRRTGELKAATLSTFGTVDVLFEESRPVGVGNGELVAYGYNRGDGARTGVFLVFVSEQTGFVVDVDGPASAEAETLAVAEQIAASWTMRPLGMGAAAGLWRQLELPQFTVPVPERFQHQTLANGWELFSGGGSFVALRRDAITGQSRASRVQHWLDVAAEGVTAFEQSDPYPFALAGRSWVRADFSYERDGQPMQGLVMMTVSNGQEHAAWAEAPADQYGELQDGVLLAMVAGSTGAGAEDQVLYSADFETPSTWGTGSEQGGQGEVSGGAYRLAVTEPEAFFWTTAGVSLMDGTYEVSATQESGPLDSGFGLLLRADAKAGRFYVLEISGDGYVWIGRCESGCATLTTLVGDGWFAHEAVSQGLGASNRLRVVADGEQLRFFVNDLQLGVVVDRELTGGDVGLFVETLGDGDVAVAFDELRVYAR